MNDVISGPKVFLFAEAWFLAYMVAFFGAGAGLARRLCSALDQRFFYFLLALSLGAFLSSVWVMIMGAFGWINHATLLVFLLAGWFFALRHARTMMDLGPARRILAWDVLFILGGLATFIAAHAPEFGTDSSAYHLYFSRLHAEAGKLVVDLTHSRSLWPAMMGMLFTQGLFLQGAALAKLFAWLVAMLAILAPVAACSALGLRRQVVIAAGLASTVPAFWQQAIYAYTDHAMMLFSWMSFVVFWFWRRQGYSRSGAFCLGLLLAALLSVKFYTLVVFAILALGIFFWIIKDALARRGPSMASFFIALATAVAFSGFWFVRSWVLTGNPVFPFLAEYFGQNGYPQSMVGHTILGRDLLALLKLPWNIATQPATFGGEPLGFLFLAAMPCMIYWRRLDEFSKSALAIGILQVVGWFYASQQTRFLFPALPFLIVGLAGSVDAWLSSMRVWKKVILSLLVVVALGQFAWGMVYPAKIIPGAVGRVAADEFVREKQHPYAIFQEIRPLLSGEDVLLSVGGSRLFYSPVPVKMYGPAQAWWRKKQGLSLEAWLRSERVSHIFAVQKGQAPVLPIELVDLAAQTARTEGSVVDENGVYFYKLWRLR